MNLISRRTALSATLLTATGLASTVWAQADYPNRPIKLVIPWGAGTPADVAARIVIEHMAVDLKQPIVIENKPGATGTVALPDMLRQPADGHTLYLLNSSSLVAPVLYPQADLNFLKVLEPVGGVELSYSVMVTAANSPFTSLNDVIKAAQAKPDALTFASAGNGSPPHLLGELFKREVKVSIMHIPYQQMGQAISDVIAGRIDCMFLGSPVALQLVKGGRLRALAISTETSKPSFPGVPTFVEAGYKGVTMSSFDGIMVRAGTPQPIVLRLNESLRKALALTAVRETFAQNTYETMPPQPPAQFGEFVASESARWIAFARSINIKVD